MPTNLREKGRSTRLNVVLDEAQREKLAIAK